MLMRPVTFLLKGLVHLYRVTFSPLVGANCRFLPTCSAYALDALDRHGAIRGSLLAARRIARCHPFAASGYDPVPGSDPAFDRSRDHGASVAACAHSSAHSHAGVPVAARPEA